MERTGSRPFGILLALSLLVLSSLLAGVVPSTVPGSTVLPREAARGPALGTPHVGAPVATQPRPASASTPAPRAPSSVPGAPAPTPQATTALLGFFTTPHTCGEVTFNATNYVSGTSATYAAGTYTVSAIPCATWYLVSLTGAGAVSIAAGVATVTAGFGNVSAVFAGRDYTVTIATDPTSCGALQWNGTTTINYVDDQTLSTSPGSFPVAAVPCTGYYNSNIVGSGNITVTFPAAAGGGVALVDGNGTITLTFLPKTLNLTVLSSPGGCGGALVGGKGIYSGNTEPVLAGTYTYQTWGCTGYTLSSVNGTNIQVTPSNPGYPVSGNLTILQSGSLNLYFSVNVYNITFLDFPGNGGSVTFGGYPYANDTSGTFTWGTILPITVDAAANFQPIGNPINFSTTGPRWEIPEDTVFINGSGFINTTFVPLWYLVNFATNQAPCELSTIVFNRSTFALVDAEGASVSAGIYQVSGPACMGFTFNGYQATGNVAVSQWTGEVWVNGSGTVTVLFGFNYLPVRGVVEEYPSGTPVAGATVFIFYGGSQVNQSAATGTNGSFALLLVYGQYSANATAPLFTTSQYQESFLLNGTPQGRTDLVVWINATLGLPGESTNSFTWLTEFPGVLVPIFLLLFLLAVAMVLHLRRKWVKLEEDRRRGPPPGTPPGAPGAPPPAGVAQLPPGPPPPTGAYGRPPGR